MDKTFEFELNQAVQISVSGEQGIVLGRAEYAETPVPQYFVRFKAADGRACEAWWSEKALQAA
jgi:hypothetical protein